MPAARRHQPRTRRVLPTATRRLAAFAGLALAATTTLVAVAVTPAFAGADDYPAPWRAPTAKDSMYDSWGELNRECTSFVAWRLHSRNGFEMPFSADAANWGSDATSRGYYIDGTPTVGSVYWTASPQHVAWVEDIVNSTQVQVEDYNYSYDGTWKQHTLNTSSASGYIHFKDSYYAAFNSGNLWTTGAAGTTMPAGGYGLAPGTSPAITVVSGGYEAAFNAGTLWVAGAVVTADTHLGMMAGTSPAITRLSDGTFEVAFQANNGHLWLYNSSGSGGDTGLGMAAGTSPAITALPGGHYQVAFNSGNLWLYGATTANTGYGMAAGTSPAITTISTGVDAGTFEAAFNSGNLWVYGLYTTQNTGHPMATGTSPAITNLLGGGYEAAYNADTLRLYGTATLDTGYGMAGGTSPAIAAVNNGYVAAFNSGNLWMYGDAYGNPYTTNTNLGMASGTNPTLATQ